MHGLINNIKKRLDFNFYWVSFFPLLFLVLTYPAMKWLPIQYTYENSLIENFQVFILFIIFFLCKNTKIDKKFYNSLALVAVILLLREVNCGRTIFFPIEGVENAFYSWKDIKYGFLAEPLYGLFIAFSGIYFLKTKSYMVLFKYIQNAKLAVYNWLFLFLGIILGTLGEKIGNFALEEMTETIFYLSLMGLIYLQAFNKKYVEATLEN